MEIKPKKKTLMMLLGALSTFFILLFNITDYYTALYVSFICIFVLCVILVVYVLSSKVFHKYFSFGAPYIPTNNKKMVLIEEILDTHKNLKVVDIGSGDGRVVFLAAKYSREAHGVEINYLLYFLSDILRAFKNSKNSKFFRVNLWNFDLSDYDVIINFGISYMMPKLEQKILDECTKGVIVITNKFDFPSKRLQNELDAIVYLI